MRSALRSRPQAPLTSPVSWLRSASRWPPARAGAMTPAPVASDKVYPVTIAVVQPAATIGTITAAGTVRYRYETPLGFTTAGKIASIRFQEGDRVMPWRADRCAGRHAGRRIAGKRARRAAARAVPSSPLPAAVRTRAGSPAPRSSAARRPRALPPRRSALQALPAEHRASPHLQAASSWRALQNPARWWQPARRSSCWAKPAAAWCCARR